MVLDSFDSTGRSSGSHLLPPDARLSATSSFHALWPSFRSVTFSKIPTTSSSFRLEYEQPLPTRLCHSVFEKKGKILLKNIIKLKKMCLYFAD